MKPKIPVFAVPAKVDVGKSPAPKKVVRTKDEQKQYAEFISKENGFLGMPASKGAPVIYVNFWSIGSYVLIMKREMENLLKENRITNEQLQKLCESAQSSIFHASLLDLKSVPQGLLDSALISSGVTMNDQNQRVYFDSIQSAYKLFAHTLEMRTDRRQYPRIQKAPSATDDHDLEPGIGSYDVHGKWQFGKQILPVISQPFTKLSTNIVHPVFGLQFGFAKNKNTDGYCLFLNDKKFWLNDQGFLLKTEAETLAFHIHSVIQKKLLDKQEWRVSSSTGNYDHILTCDFSYNENFDKQCRIVCFTSGNSCSLMMFSPIGEKLFQHVFVFAGLLENIHHRAVHFAANYMAAELAAYCYCAAHGKRTPHPAQVAPNGNPWSSFRLMGGVSASFASSYGQGAININSTLSYALPHKQYNPVENITVEIEEHAQYEHMRSISWNDFVSQVEINEQATVVEFSHASSPYRVQITKGHAPNKRIVTTISSNGTEIEKFVTNSVIPSNDDTIGMIALSMILGVHNAPTYLSMGIELENAPSTPMASNAALNFSDNSQFFSAEINHSSYTLRKFSSPGNVHGLLTPIFYLAQDKNPISFMQPSLSQDYDGIIQKIIAPQLVVTTPNSSLNTNQNPTDKFFNTDGIIRAVVELKNTQMIIPDLPKMHPDYHRVDFDKGTYVPILKIRNQKYGLSYVVKLVGEYIPDLENIIGSDPENAISSLRDINDPINEPTDFDKYYAFEILCLDRDGSTIIDYTPTHFTPSGYVPRLRSLEDIISIYLPDFIAWVNTYGIYEFNNQLYQSVLSAEQDKKTYENISGRKIPLSQKLTLDWTLNVKKWLSKSFPSILDEVPFKTKTSSVFSHLMKSVTLVDYKRQDGYMPSEEIGNENNAALLRATMLFHDISKISVIDGGVGPYEKEHETKSVELASKMLSEMGIYENNRLKILKWIQNHHLFEKAIRGEFGKLDDAIQHVATVIGKNDMPSMYYHIFRCDTETFPDYGTNIDSIATNKSEILGVSPKEFLSLVENRIKNSQLKTINSVINNNNFFSNAALRATTNSDSVINLAESSLPQFVSKTHRFTAYSSSWGEKKVFEEYNPGYFDKLKYLEEDVINNPGKSFAQEFEMSYEGPTGTIIRCFFWTRPENLSNIFSNGLRSYSGKDSRSFVANINGPMIVNYANNGFVSSEINLKNYDEARSVVIFDYHLGNFLYQDEVEETLSIMRKWKQKKLGPQMFSLGFSVDDVSDGSTYLMEIGYTGIIKSLYDENGNLSVGISCFDPSRVGLISAFTMPRGIYEGMMNDPIGIIHHSYKAYPSNVLVRSSFGFDKIITLPKINPEEIFLNNSHKLFAKIGVSEDKKSVTENGSKLWRGTPLVRKDFV